MRPASRRRSPSTGSRGTPVIVESPHRTGPFGAKGVGETALIPFAPAVANAVRDAAGVRITTLPLTPERVLTALREGANSANGGTGA